MRQRDKNVREAGEQGTGSGRLWTPPPHPTPLARKVKTSLVLSEESWQLFLLVTKHRSVIACLIYWCLSTQVEEEHESRGGRRRTWDDEHVLKRQFSALVPAFDPRPGRTNIAQTQDIVIPAPGEGLLLTNSSHMAVLVFDIALMF